MSKMSSRRWCPTPEQVMVLEELYRRGLRTPQASQIQKITAHLSLYGSIQGKNVFYWFQNHKARDRQKLRKRLALAYHHRHHFPTSHTIIPFHFSFPFQVGEYVGNDWLMRRYENLQGDDDSGTGTVSATETHTDTLLGCNTTKPLQTLQLFPLTSPTIAPNHTSISTSSYFQINTSSSSL